MKKAVSRREFLHAGLLGSAGTALVWQGMGDKGRAAGATQGVCVTLCNHWSYIGIGWQLGIESCVLSATDAMEMADRPPHVKTCINLDARAYEFMAEKFPEVTERLKKYLAAGKVELIGGTYGQPMGTMFSGESNIRQIVVGRETIRKALDYEMVTFLEEEEFSHPQLPQILAGAGFRHASLAQVDTWGRAGCPVLEFNAVRWKGIDGTAIPTIPKNSLFGYSPDLKKLATSAAFQKLQALGKPLIFTWEEFGWESPEQPAYLSVPAKYKEFAEKSPVEFVTCKEYLDKYGSNPKEAIYLPMDAWNKSLTWGLGGDQLRILDRKVESLLLAAERFDAVASTLSAPSQAAPSGKGLERSACLAEPRRGALRVFPLARRSDGAVGPDRGLSQLHLGYDRVQPSRRRRKTRPSGARRLSRPYRHTDQLRAGKAGLQGGHGLQPPVGGSGTAWCSRGGFTPSSKKPKDVVVKDHTGHILASQVIKDRRDRDGNLVMASLTFVSGKVPSVGYDTYYLDFTPQAAAAAPSALRIDEPRLTLENEHVQVRLDPVSGGVASLIDKRSGREAIDGAKGAFPAFSGRPNPGLSLRPKPPANYDSSKSKAQISTGWRKVRCAPRCGRSITGPI